MDQQQSADIHQLGGDQGGDSLVDQSEGSESNQVEFDAAKQKEINKQKIVEISEHLAAIDDQEIVDACNKRLDIDKQREVLNKSAEEVREHLKDLGISGPAFNAAYSRFKQDAHKRDVFDQEFAKCANAMGVEYQKDLF